MNILFTLLFRKLSKPITYFSFIFLVFFYIFFIFLSKNIQAQSNKRAIVDIQSSINGKTVSFTEFIQAMRDADKLVPKSTDKVYEFVLKDIQVRFVKDIDKGKGGMDARFMNTSMKEIIINSNLRLANINFDPEFWFVPYRLRFKGHLWLTKIENMKAIFQECVFEKSFAIFSSEFDFIDFSKCTFYNGFRQMRSTTIDHLKFDDCVFDVQKELRDDIALGNLGVETRPFILDNKVQNLDLTIQNCQFKIHESLRNNEQFFIMLKGSVFSNLRFINNQIETSLNLENCSVSNNFQFSKTDFLGKLFLFGINMNPLGTRIDWEKITKKLAVFESQKHTPYSYTTMKDMPLGMFNDLFSTYAIVYTAFKSQGNRYSTNQCYIEWKNLETEYLKKASKNNPDIVVYFTYLMNVFLQVFCDYGTNPLKSLYMSSMVLLSFAVIYFFLPHGFGYKNITFYASLHLYFRHWEGKSDVSGMVKRLHFKKNVTQKHIFTYIHNVKKGKNRFWYISHWFILALPDVFLFYIMRNAHETRLKCQLFISSLCKHKQGSMRFLGKFLVLFLVFWLIFSHLFWRAMDCLALSLNIFTTLGFGNIDLKGLPMYLTVIEGFAGWFLLSFFSLSLVSQLIN